jgi:hypothetical protein
MHPEVRKYYERHGLRGGDVWDIDGVEHVVPYFDEADKLAHEERLRQEADRLNAEFVTNPPWYVNRPFDGIDKIAGTGKFHADVNPARKNFEQGLDVYAPEFKERFGSEFNAANPVHQWHYKNWYDAKYKESLPFSILMDADLGLRGAAEQGLNAIADTGFNPFGVGDWMREQAARSKDDSDAIRAVRSEYQATSPFWSSAIEGTANSLAQAMALRRMGLGVKGINTGFGVSTAFDSYRNAVDEGMGASDARLYGLIDGVFEGGIAGVFNKIGMGGFEKLLAEKTGVRREGIKQFAKEFLKDTYHENIEEIATSVAQKLNADLHGLPSETLGDTILSTVAQTALMMGVSQSPRGAAASWRSVTGQTGERTPAAAVPVVPVQLGEAASATPEQADAERGVADTQAESGTDPDLDDLIGDKARAAEREAEARALADAERRKALLVMPLGDILNEVVDRMVEGGRATESFLRTARDRIEKFARANTGRREASPEQFDNFLRVILPQDFSAELRAELARRLHGEDAQDSVAALREFWRRLEVRRAAAARSPDELRRREEQARQNQREREEREQREAARKVEMDRIDRELREEQANLERGFYAEGNVDLSRWSDDELSDFVDGDGTRSERVRAMLELAQADPDSVAWFDQARRDLEGRHRRAEAEAVETSTGEEDLLKVMRKRGWVIPTLVAGLQGEIDVIRANAGKGKGIRLFRRPSSAEQGAKDFDILRQNLESYGFAQFETQNALLDALERMMMGGKILPQRRADFAEQDKAGQRDMSAPVSVPSVDAGAGLERMRAGDVVRWLKSKFTGVFRNRDTRWEIGVAAEGARHSGTQNRGETRKPLEALDKLIENAIWLGRDTYKGDKPKIKWQHRFYVPVKIDGQLWLAKLRVNETFSGEKLYDARATKIIKLDAYSPVRSPGYQRPKPPHPVLVRNVAELVDVVKQAYPNDAVDTSIPRNEQREKFGPRVDFVDEAEGAEGGLDEAAREAFPDGVPESLSGKGVTGREFYTELSGKLQDKRRASMLLLKHGFDGISYWANSGAQHTNYVVFDENAVEIQNRVDFAEEAGDGHGGRLNIPQRKGLTPEQRQREEAFARQLNERTDAQNDAVYDSLPMSQGGRVFNTDTARSMSAEYEKDPAGNVEATSEPAGAYVRDRFLREIAKPATSDDVVEFTAGGPGSGKSVSADGRAALVFDSMLADLGEAIRLIDRVLASGRKVSIVYTHNPVERAVRFAHARAKESGRDTPAEYIGRKHFHAQQTFLALREKYRGNDSVKVELYDNSGAKGEQKQIENPVAFLKSPDNTYDNEQDTISRAKAEREKVLQGLPSGDGRRTSAIEAGVGETGGGRGAGPTPQIRGSESGGTPQGGSGVGANTGIDFAEEAKPPATNTPPTPKELAQRVIHDARDKWLPDAVTLDELTDDELTAYADELGTLGGTPLTTPERENLAIAATEAASAIADRRARGAQPMPNIPASQQELGTETGPTTQPKSATRRSPAQGRWAASVADAQRQAEEAAARQADLDELDVAERESAKEWQVAQSAQARSAREASAEADRGKVAQLQGHTKQAEGYKLRLWGKIVELVKGFTSALPELGIGAKFRDNRRVLEGYLELKRGMQRALKQAQDEVSRVIEPILALRYPLNANLYAQYQKRAAELGTVAKRISSQIDTIRKALRSDGEGLPPDLARLFEARKRAKAELSALAKDMDAEELRMPAEVRDARLTRLEATILGLTRELEAKMDAQATAAEKKLEKLRDELESLGAPLADDAYFIFQNFLLFRDLHNRATDPDLMTRVDEQGNPIPITLPFGISPATATAKAKYWAEKVRGHPESKAIVEAVRRHEALVTRSFAELLKRNPKIAGQWNGGKRYFPHVITEFWTGRAKRFQMDTMKEFRGYLIQPEGDTRPIETDYVKAMWYHMAAVHADNIHQDTVLNFFSQFDQTKRLAEQAKEENSSVDKLAREEGLVPFVPSDEMEFHKGIVIDRDKLAEALGVILGQGPIQDELRKLGIANLKITRDMINEALLAGQKLTWFLPKEVADALRAINEESGRKVTLGDYLIGRPTQWWKTNILFAPWNWLRYEFGNTVADTQKLFEFDPAVFRLIPQAAMEIKAFFTGTGNITQEVRDAFRHGVFDTITENEAERLRELPEFDKLKSDREKVASLVRKLVGFGVTGSRYREAIYRYAVYKLNLERYRNNATPAYGGAYWRDIESMGESAPGAGDTQQRKAAAISLATLVDFQAISKTGKWIRRMMIPFYSFQEANFRYYINLFRNTYDMALAKDPDARGVRAKVVAGTKAALLTGSGFTAKAAVGFAIRMALPIALMNLWHYMFFREEEDEISAEDRRRPHIILGRDGAGKIRLVYLNNNMAEMLRWVGGNRFAKNAMDFLSGRTDFATAAIDWATGIPSDFLNNAASVGPIQKAGYSLLTRQNIFPDVMDQRAIPKSDLGWVILGQMTDQHITEVIRRALDKDYYSRDTLEWVSQTILQVRRRDPEQWAYYAIRDKSADFVEAKTGRHVARAAWDAPEAQVLRNFRRAIYKGDVPEAVRFYNRLLHYGYTAERFKSSIRSQDPLSDLPKKDGTRTEFVSSLSQYELQMLSRAEAYYRKIASLRGSERKLFPHEGRTATATQSNIQRFRTTSESKEEILKEKIKLEMEQDHAEKLRKADEELRRSLRRR